MRRKGHGANRVVRSKKEIQLLEALETAACAQGFDLVDLEFAGLGKSALLRVYIDKEDGLTLDEVAAANAWVSAVVEGLDPYRGSYTLEVSSPGIDRPLRTWRHFERAVGEDAVITLDGGAFPHTGKDGESKPRLKYSGVITGADPEGHIITLEADGVAYPLAFEHIKKARIKGRLDFEGREDD